MRDTRIHRALESWLRHEAAGRDRRAEAALASIFALLPRAEPSAEFLAKVLAGAGFEAPARRLRAAGPRLRALVLVCGALVATALALLPTLLSALAALVRTGKPLELAAAALAAGIQRIGESLALWETLAGVSGAVGSALASPLILAILALCAAVSLLAFKLLESLLVSDRSTYYAEL
ncbi:MAG: hypothetical protein R3325_04835 [Thermoanaerobaculia bacterium]|nr:hypothetical protein [Thermoanaerobaculia bacterium]